MSVEFLLTSLVVVLILGTGVFYTVSSSIGGRRRGLFAAVRWVGVAYLVFVGVSMIRDAGYLP